MSYPHGPIPPPPPAPIQRGPTPSNNFPRPPPPANFQPRQMHNNGGGGHPGPQMQIPMRPMPTMQNSTRISDITPAKTLDESACLKLLTEYRAITLRKVAPGSSHEKPTWARAEVCDEYFDQSEIIHQIKKLNQRTKSVSEKKTALAPHQQTQVNRVLDDLVSTEKEDVFQWSLAQLYSSRKDITPPGRKKKRQETVTLTVYAKRAPISGVNPAVLYRDIERAKFEQEKRAQEDVAFRRAEQLKMQQMQHQQQQQQHHMPPHPGVPPHSGHAGPHGAHPGGPGGGIITLGKGGGGGGGGGGGHGHKVKAIKAKHGHAKKHRDYHDSDSDSASSYSDSLSDSDGDSESFISSDKTSVDSASRTDSRHKDKRRHSKGATRSHSRHRPEAYYLEGARSPSPRRRLEEQRRSSDAYGGIPQRPYAVPEVPRMVPAVDAISSAYQAGREDGVRERIGSPEREAPRPIVIERIIERPQPVICYGRPNLRIPEPRRIEDREPRSIQERYVEDIDPRESYVTQQQKAEEYLRRRPSLDSQADYHRELARSLYSRRASSPVHFTRRPPSPTRVDGFYRQPVSPTPESYGRRSFGPPVRFR